MRLPFDKPARLVGGLVMLLGASGAAMAGEDGWPAARPAGARFDAGLRRVQDVLPLPETAPPVADGVSDLAGGAPAAPTFDPSAGVPDLGVPAADRPIGGGMPTLETEAAEAAEEDSADEPWRLWHAMGNEDYPVQIYGWIQNSYTGNTNGKPASGENFGVWPNHRANSWMGNQYYIVVEDALEQTDEINFGFRVDNLFGNDWQWNFMQGLLNDSFKLNSFAGYDPAQFYGEVHLPVLTEGGLDIKGGRWYTLAGYEQVPAIARPLLSVPYMFNYGQPFTHFGALTTLHLTDKINVYNGAINGWDRFINENYNWGYIGGFTWTGNEDKTTLAFTYVWGPNEFPRFLPGNAQIYPTGYINVPQLANRENRFYNDRDRHLFTTVLTHKWSDKLTQVIETDQGWEEKVPGLASQGRNARAADAQWQSFGNWFLYSFNEKLTGVWRSEVFWDQQGARTGLLRGDRFYEITLGAIYKPCPNLWIRPEARYDWAQYHSPYNDGTRDSQFTLALDAIILF